jgi:signal transduction histidine kinase
VDLNLSRLTWLVAPTAGATYIVLWWIAEAGRLGNAPLGPVVALVPFIVFGLAIGISQWLPTLALCLIGGVLVLQLLVESARFGNTSWPAYVPLLYVVFNVSAFGPPLSRRLALPVASVYAVTVALLLTLPMLGQSGWPILYSLDFDGTVPTPADLQPGMTLLAGCLIAVALTVGAWCAGFALRIVAQAREARMLAQALERELATAEAELVELSERDRLARDVHDVMAHSLAVIAAQADGTRMMDAGLSSNARDGLATIAEVARDGLKELRHLLDAASGDEEWETVDLAALFDRVRAAGHESDLVVFGDAKLLAATQRLSVYRIVQEALTNGLKHVGAAGVTRAAFDWRGPGLAILISTTSSAVEPTAPGRGIRGMKERARLAGGWLTASVDDGGSFIVNAFIPAIETDEDTSLKRAETTEPVA